MTVQELMDLPGYGSATDKVIEMKQWDYDYPSWMIDRISDITGITLTEDQKNDVREVYEELMEDMG